MKPEQFAIASVSTSQPSLDEVLAAYAQAGFGRVEFALSHIKPWLAEGRTPSDLKRELDRLSLRCIGGFETTLSCFADEEARRSNIDLHVANAQLLAELGGGTMVVGTDGPRNSDDSGGTNVDALRVVGRTLRTLAELMPASVRLALEFNWSPLVRSFKSAVMAVQAAEHPRVGVLFDTAHYHCTPSKFEHLTDDAVALIGHVHLNDMPDKGGDLTDCNEDRLLPGDGALDLERIVGRLEDGGYRGPFSIEMFSAELRALSPAEAAQRCHAAMMRLCSR